MVYARFFLFSSDKEIAKRKEKGVGDWVDAGKSCQEKNQRMFVCLLFLITGKYLQIRKFSTSIE